MGIGLLTLMALSPAAAADTLPNPPMPAQVAIRSLGMAATAESACPEYRVDVGAADALALRMRAEETARRYADFTRATAAQYARMLAESRPAFCRLAWTLLGKEGAGAHILERK